MMTMSTTIGKSLLAMVMTAMLVGMVQSQMRTDVCQAVSNANAQASLTKKRPEIAQQFTVDVECNLLEQRSTVYIREYYNYNINRGRLTKTRSSGVSDYYMDYDKNLILQVDLQTGQCDAGLLMLQPDRFLFGFSMKGLQSQMFSPAAALRFGGNISEAYVNRTTVRGINVDHWRSCQYIADINATAQVDWYFSNLESWSMQVGGGIVPVRMTAIGKMVQDNQAVVPFNHSYEFFNFRPTVYDTDFQVPDGVFCPGRNLVDKPPPFPTIPNNFYFIGETADKHQHGYSILEEYYMYDNHTNITNLAFYKFRRDPKKLTTVNGYQELNDYGSGVSYLIDNTRGSCVVSPITQAKVKFSVQINNQQVRMETPQEFFMESGVDYQYTGTVMARNIPADRWVGITNKAFDLQGTNVTIVWYIAKNNLNSWNWNLDQFRAPLQLRLYNGGVTEPFLDFNIFYYNAQTAWFSQVDINLCFADALRLPLRFTIPKNQEDLVRRNVENSKLAIQGAISLYTGISPTRVSDIQLYFNPDNVEVSLVLLGKPPSFNDVPSAMLQNSLCVAAKLLRDAFREKVFSFSFYNGTDAETVTPGITSLEALSDICSQSTRSPYTPGSSTRFTLSPGQTTTPRPVNGTVGQQTDTGRYSSGAFAGLAVSMLIAGGLGGALGGFLFFK